MVVAPGPFGSENSFRSPERRHAMGRHLGSSTPNPAFATIRARTASGFVAALVVLRVSSATAGTDIQGTPDNLNLNLQNATIVEVLNALSTRFQITFKARSHNPRILTGAYSGTLRETLTRILDGNDYILERSDKGLEITILGSSGPEQQNPPRQPATASASAPPSPTAAPASPPKPTAGSGPAGAPKAGPSLSASVPPLSSFAVVPPLTP
jgi:hypothetical protein